jgi:hypothetical protein
MILHVHEMIPFAIYDDFLAHEMVPLAIEMIFQFARWFTELFGPAWRYLVNNI